MRTFVFIVLSCITSSVLAQTHDDHTVLSIINYLFLPKGIVEGYQLRDDILSKDYSLLPSGTKENDRQRFDAIYEDAFFQCKGDVKASMLASLLAVFEHKTIPVNFFGGRIDIPLSLESSERFDERVKRLPIYLYHDGVADGDKSQHFFMSAYLKRVLGSGLLVKALGELVELGEDIFIIGGANDRRDVVANIDGIRFAIVASVDSVSSPSKMLSPNP